MEAENLHTKPTAESVFKEYEKGVSFKQQIGLFDTVIDNENMFVGNQWEGVQANGMPTPTFNFIKPTILFQVASLLADSVKMKASPLAISPDPKYAEMVAEIISNEFDALFERNKIGSLLRKFTRNAAVDGDGCLFTYWDDTLVTGQPVKGAIVTEVVENTRVFFGNQNDSEVQKQPYITIECREMLRSVKRRAKQNGVKDLDMIQADTDANGNATSKLTDGRTTVLLRMWKDDDTGEIWATECVKGVTIREPWSLGVKLYPIVWLNWDYIQDSYHGQASVTGLIPNQIFVNKIYAMVAMSMMQSAFPKVIYDKTRISKWTNQVGVAIGVNGGNMGDIAKIIEGTQISPQIFQFADSVIENSQKLMGATAAAMGYTRPDNKGAIIALQRASAIPQELTKQNLYQCVEDLGNIYEEFMIANYGVRIVKTPDKDLQGMPLDAMGVEIAETLSFDFGSLRDMPMYLKLDVGASSFWSEEQSMQTMENILMLNNPDFDLLDFFERMPKNMMPDTQGMIDKIKGKRAGLPPMPNDTGANGDTAPPTASIPNPPQPTVA